jgi:hypothetical protein
MAMNLEAALQSLDPKKDEQWTGDGLPRMDVLQELTGNAELTRRDVSGMAANFTRDNPTLEKGDAPAPNGDTDQGTTTPGPDEAADKEAAKPDENQDVDGAKTGADENAPAEPPSPPAVENDKPGEPPSDDPDNNVDVDDQPTTPPADEVGEDEVDDEAEVEALSSLEEELADVGERIAKGNERMAELKREQAELQADQDRLLAAREARKDPDDDLKARLAFIQSQHAVRAERAGAIREAQAIREAATGARSALDQAMGNRPGRFTARPPAQPRRNQGGE